MFTHNLHPCLLKLLCLTAAVLPCSDDDFDMSRYSSSGYSSAEVRCLRDQVSIHTLSTVSQHHFSDSADNPRRSPSSIVTPPTPGICALIKKRNLHCPLPRRPQQSQPRSSVKINPSSASSFMFISSTSQFFLRLASLHFHE